LYEHAVNKIQLRVTAGSASGQDAAKWQNSKWRETNDK